MSKKVGGVGGKTSVSWHTPWHRTGLPARDITLFGCGRKECACRLNYLLIVAANEVEITVIC